MLAQYMGEFVALGAGLATTLVGGWVAVQQVNAFRRKSSTEHHAETLEAMNRSITTLTASLAACHRRLADCGCHQSSMTSSSNGTSTTSSESSENIASNE